MDQHGICIRPHQAGERGQVPLPDHYCYEWINMGSVSAPTRPGERGQVPLSNHYCCQLLSPWRNDSADGAERGPAVFVARARIGRMAVIFDRVLIGFLEQEKMRFGPAKRKLMHIRTQKEQVRAKNLMRLANVLAKVSLASIRYVGRSQS